MKRALLLILISTVARSAEAPGAVEPMGIAISGGVSLGSWEAGFMYLYLEAQKTQARSKLRVVTGASAGSANAFISAVSSCLPSNPHPLEDPGWKVWGPIGFAQLFNPHRANDEALFVGVPFEESIERVRLVWNLGLPEACDVVVGVAVTRVTPRKIQIQEGLTVPRSMETFVVRIQGRGMGKAPRLSNYVDPLGLMPAPLLPFLDADAPDATEKNFTQLRSLVLASGAFPLAFEPRRIEYCLSKPGRAGKPGDTRCEVPDFTDLFVDGGVFDNNPLRLAWNIADHRLLRLAGGRFAWADPRTTTEETQQPAVQYLYLDPDTRVFPAEPPLPNTSPETGFLSRVLPMSGEMVESAQARELGQLVNERADLSARLHLAMGNLPKASEHLFAFIGFFEKDFRLFDFYVGMYDALVELRTTAAWKGSGVDFDAMLAGDEDAKRGWAPFMCLLSMTEPAFERYRAQCAGPELENFRILLQVSLDRLDARCRPGPADPKPSATRPHFRCEQAALGHDGAQVPGVTVLSAQERRQEDGEATFDHFMRLLGAYHFEFKDLGLSRRQAGEGRLAIRQRLDEVVDEWAGAQGSFTTRFMAKSTARLALHNIEFSPPLFSGSIALGTTVQAGMSIVPFFWKPRWLQLNGVLALGQLETLATEARPRLSMTLAAGPEVHLTFLSNSLVQPRLALRGGVQFSAFDHFGAIACTAVDARDCTQGVVEMAGVVTLLERLFVHLTWQTFPRLYGRPGFFHLQLGVGFQFL
jgi:predicted acylesterase/phospholipase RssA